MKNLTSIQCLALANKLSKLQAEIAEYKHVNFSKLNDEQKETFKKALKALSDSAGMLFAFTVVIAMDEAKESISALEAATEEMDSIVKSIAEVQKWINIAGSAFSLATAVLSQNPKNIADGIKNVVESIKAV